MATIGKLKEHEVQAQIVDALRLCGLVVQETTAYRQKGSSGVDKGVPDLLVWVPGFKTAIGLEVKRDEKAPRTPEQRAMCEQGFYPFVWTVEMALDAVHEAMIHTPHAAHVHSRFLQIEKVRKAFGSGRTA
jgi:hypothetical protein